MRKALIMALFIVALMNYMTWKDMIAAESFQEEEIAIGSPDRSIEADEEKSGYPKALISTVPDIAFALYSEGIYCIYDGQKYGYMDKDGSEIISPIYDEAAPFHEGLASVAVNDKYGFINPQGEIVVPIIYDKVTSFHEGLAYFELAESYGFLNQAGEAAFLLDYDSVSTFNEGLAYVSLDGKYGYINQKGEEVIPFIYDDADYFRDGLARIRIKGYVGAVNAKGELVIPAEYEDLSFENGFIITAMNGKKGCYNHAGVELLAPEYRDIDIEGGYIIFRSESDDSYGAADKTGRILFAGEYKSVHSLGDSSLFVVEQNQQAGVIDSEGNISVPIAYDSIEWSDDNINLPVPAYSAGKGGYLDIIDGSVSIPFIYDEVSDFIDGKAVVKVNGKYGIIDARGNIVAPFDFEYGQIEIFADGVILVIRKGRYSLVDYEGKPLTKKTYDEIRRVGSCFMVEKDGKYGFLNELGKEYISPVYDEIKQFDYPVYNTNNYYGTMGKRMKTIIHLEEAEPSYPAWENIITPRLKLYHEFILTDEMEHYEDPWEDYELFYRLYDDGNSKKPILFVWREPSTQFVGRHSISGFYSIEDDQLQILVQGYETGGTAGGDSVGFFADRETGAVVIGASWYAGGFGGSAFGKELYRWNEGVLEGDIDICYIGEPAANYSAEELAESWQTFYDSDDNPYTREGIKTADFVARYEINEKPVSPKEFDEAFKQYDYVTIFK